MKHISKMPAQSLRPQLGVRELRVIMCLVSGGGPLSSVMMMVQSPRVTQCDGARTITRWIQRAGRVTGQCSIGHTVSITGAGTSITAL